MEKEKSFLAKISDVFSDNKKCSSTDAEIICRLVTDKFLKKADQLINCKDLKCDDHATKIDRKCMHDVELSNNQELEIFGNRAMCEIFQNYVNNSNDSSRNDSREQKFGQQTGPNSFQDSIGTSDISSLITDLDSTYKSYNSFAKNIFQRNSTLADSNFDEDLFPENADVFELWDAKSTELLKEADVQLQIIFETSKALNTCLSLKEFSWGPEYLEAEKILLLADFKRQHILDKLIKHTNDNEEILLAMDCVGELSLLNISFSIEQNSNIEHNFVFIVIVSHQNIAIASEITHVRNDKEVHFKKLFNFDNLSSDFEISIGIYCMQIKNRLKTYSHESKFHLKQDSTICLLPSKLFKKTASNSSLCFNNFTRRRPSFVLLGTTTIRIANITKKLPILLNILPTCSFLKSYIFVNFKSSVKFTSTHSSFLTLGSDVNEVISWNRYWCDLNGFKLNFWNYPSEQDGTKPTKSIDLRYCIKSQVEAVDRKLCARPRTLYLQIESIDRDNVYYLSADTTADMQQLREKLNTVLSGLHYWNCMKC